MKLTIRHWFTEDMNRVEVQLGRFALWRDIPEGATTGDVLDVVEDLAQQVIDYVEGET